MFDEDNIESVQEPAENILIIQLAAMGALTAWALGGNCAWAPGMVAAIGFFAPVLLLIHNNTTYLCKPFRKARYLECTLPVWGLLALTGLDYLQPLLAEVSAYGGEFLSLQIGNPWMPGSALDVRWVGALSLCGAYLGAFNLLVVPATRLSLKHILRALSINAILMAIFGIICVLLRAKTIAFFVKGPGTDFFSMFPSSVHWCYFALLWMAALLGLCTQTLDVKRSWKYFLTENVFPIGGIVTLGVTVAYRGSPVQMAIMGALVCTAAFWCAIRMRHQKGYPTWLTGLLSAGALVAVVWGIVGAVVLAESTPFWLANRFGISNALDWATRLELWRQGWEMFLARPLWGWGPGAFGAVFAFFQNAQAGNAYYGIAGSDFLQFLTEQGVLLTVIWLVFPLFFLWRARKDIRASSFAPVPLLGCALIALCALPDFPFGSPAVLVSWWIIFFAAIQWARLEAKANRPRPAPKPLLRRNAPKRPQG